MVARRTHVEPETIRHGRETEQHVEAIIDEMSDAEIAADRGLLASLHTESNLLRLDPRSFEEAVTLHPAQRLRAMPRTTLRDEEDTPSEPAVDELPDDIHRVTHLRRIEIVLSKRGRVGVDADARDDHAPDVDAECFSSYQSFTPRRTSSSEISSSWRPSPS